MSIVIFSGGRGNKNLLKTIIQKESSNFNLDIIVNGLDDGASTGSIREIFDDKVHGISDFLKVALALSKNDELTNILEKRLPETKNYQENLLLLESINKFISSSDDLFVFDKNDALKKYREELQSHFRNFLEYVFKKFGHFKDMGDFKVGNVVFASYLVTNSMDFQSSLISFMKFLEVNLDRFKIHQSTFKNSYLVGLLKSGSLLPNEASVVLTRTSDYILETFQIPRPLSASEIRTISSKELEDKIDYLREIEFIPETGEEVKSIITNCEAIVYGAGTPYSSLLPSLELKGIAEAIKSKNHPKILVANLVKETSNTLTVEDLVENILQYICKSIGPDKKFLVSDFITHIIIPDDLNKSEENWIDADIQSISNKYNSIKVVKGNIRTPNDSSKHDGEALLRIILDIIDG